MASDHSVVTAREGQDALIAALDTDGYRVCGPTERNSASFVNHAENDGDDEKSAVFGARACELAALKRTPVGLRTGASIQAKKSDCLPAEMETRHGC